MRSLLDGNREASLSVRLLIAPLIRYRALRRGHGAPAAVVRLNRDEVTNATAAPPAGSTHSDTVGISDSAACWSTNPGTSSDAAVAHTNEFHIVLAGAPIPPAGFTGTPPGRRAARRKGNARSTCVCAPQALGAALLA